jgi:hypothetical protein
LALGEWLRQVMVETSALKHRASSVARLMASRQLVALRIQSSAHTLLFVERDSLRPDFLFLAGPRPKVTELFRGNAVDLVLERTRLQAEADRADVVAAPWKFFEERAETLRWYPFLDAGLPVAATVDDQIGRVPLAAHQKKLRAVSGDPAVKLRISRAHKDFDRFYAELYAPYQKRAQVSVDERKGLHASFREGGALALVEGRGGRALAGALLLTRRRGALTFHRSGFADAASLTATQLAHRTAALELLFFRHANALGFAMLDFGFTPSLLTHPLFVQKRRLGCTFSPTPSSPALMLTVNRALRPSLFARAPLLTGEPGAFVVQAGLSRAGKAKPRSMCAQFKEFDVAGCHKVALSTDAQKDSAGRKLCERVLLEEVPRLRVEVDEV